MTVTPFTGGIILTLVEAVGDFSLKKYAMGASAGFLGLGVGIYGILAWILTWLFRHLGLAITNAYWDGMSNVMTMALGGILFGETYTLKQWAGMAIITVGLFLLG
jgi:multidrug transporter EmrE-like cation transporter